MKIKQPLNYAILLYFNNNSEGDAGAVMEALAPEYGHYRAFKKKAVIESLMTAKENGILNETREALAEATGEPNVFYSLTEYGRDLIKRFL